MTPELETKLLTKYPKLFAQHSKPPSETCMCWGCDCDDGWFKILDDLCEKLKDYPIEFVQIKEKYGTLRAYYTFNLTDERKDLDVNKVDDSVWDIICDAEKLSAKTCEVCGEKGTLHSSGFWLKTMCHKCTEKKEYNDYELLPP
jgi:hypothetical protein